MTRVRCAIYQQSPENGSHRIAKTVSGSGSAVQAQLQPGQALQEVLTHVTDATHYLDLSLNVMPRPESPVSIDRTSLVADGDDAVTMTDLAEDTRIIVSGPVPDEITVADGTVVWRCLVPGEYRLRIEAPFPHRPAEVVIHGS